MFTRFRGRWRRAVYWIKCAFFWGCHRPQRLFRGDRKSDQDFRPNERLFFRCLADCIDSEGNIKPTFVRPPNQSVNREKYSLPTDVLLPDQLQQHKDWLLFGVLAATVERLPKEMTSGDHKNKVTYTFYVSHEPEEDNYSHSELTMSKNGKREQKSSKINDEIKKKYKIDLAAELKLIVTPLTSLEQRVDDS